MERKVVFTKRELQILELTAKGFKSNEIADRLFISTYTINAHKQNIQQKYGFHTIIAAISYCLYHNLIDITILINDK